MDEQQKATYMQCQATCAVIEAMAMQADNQIQIQNNCPLKYNGTDFTSLIERYGIHHNSVVNYFLNNY